LFIVTLIGKTWIKFLFAAILLTYQLQTNSSEVKQKKNNLIMKKVSIKTLTIVLSLIATFAKADCIFEQGLQPKELGIGTMLSWSTSEETNNAQFIVEKSENGTEYTNVGTVKGGGTHQTKKMYNFLDARAGGAMKVFYRLKVVDFDGTLSYSEIIMMNRQKANNLALVQMSSETTARLFSCAVDAYTEGSAKLSLVNGQGQTVWQGDQKFTDGLNSVTVDLSGQKEGTYKLMIELNKETETLVIRKSLDDVERKINVATTRRALGPNR
jgi:hypothetical protein